jgi:antitoxin FitA
MGPVSVNVSDAVVADVEVLARENGTSLERQIDTILQFALGNIRRKETLFDAAKRIAAMTPKSVAQTPTEQLIREERDR